MMRLRQILMSALIAGASMKIREVIVRGSKDNGKFLTHSLSKGYLSVHSPHTNNQNMKGGVK